METTCPSLTEFVTQHGFFMDTCRYCDRHVGLSEDRKLAHARVCPGLMSKYADLQQAYIRMHDAENVLHHQATTLVVGDPRRGGETVVTAEPISLTNPETVITSEPTDLEDTKSNPPALPEQIKSPEELQQLVYYLCTVPKVPEKDRDQMETLRLQLVAQSRGRDFDYTLSHPDYNYHMLRDVCRAAFDGLGCE